MIRDTDLVTVGLSPEASHQLVLSELEAFCGSTPLCALVRETQLPLSGGADITTLSLFSSPIWADVREAYASEHGVRLLTDAGELRVNADGVGVSLRSGIPQRDAAQLIAAGACELRLEISLTALLQAPHHELRLKLPELAGADLPKNFVFGSPDDDDYGSLYPLEDFSLATHGLSHEAAHSASEQILAQGYSPDLARYAYRLKYAECARQVLLAGASESIDQMLTLMLQATRLRSLQVEFTLACEFEDLFFGGNRARQTATSFTKSIFQPGAQAPLRL